MTFRLFRRSFCQAGLGLTCLMVPARAQISLATAVDLAMRNSPRVQAAAADVARARAAVQEQRDVYIPNLTAGGTGYGRSSGFPLGQPTVVSIQSQSLVFNYSQQDYLRAAQAGLDASALTLLETRQTVAEDVALVYLALDHDAERQIALKDQQGFADRLVAIVQARLDAGQDTPTNLTSAQLTAAQIRLTRLRTEDDALVDAARLSHLTGVPLGDVPVVREAMPTIAEPDRTQTSLGAATSPGVDAAYAASRSKRQLAFGDARYLLRPQVTFGAQYSRFSTFNNGNYLEYYGRRDAQGNLLPFQLNTIGIGVQVSLPILDFGHRAKARESAADALRAEYDADQQRDLFTEARLRLQRSTLELATRAEIAQLDLQLAQQQLEVLAIQLNAPAVSGAAPTTPKEDQNAHLTERDKYLTLLDARYQLRQAMISLLRQTGGLEVWIRSTPSATNSPSALISPSVQP